MTSEKSQWQNADKLHRSSQQSTTETKRKCQQMKKQQILVHPGNRTFSKRKKRPYLEYINTKHKVRQNENLKRNSRKASRKK